MKNLHNKLRDWKYNVKQFANEEFGIQKLEKWQVEAFEAFPDPEKQRIAFKACKGVGKTAAEAILIWNFMLCYGEKGDHPKGAATSITGDNLDDNLWAELAKWRGQGKLTPYFFEWTKTRIHSKEHPETWFFSKRTWPKSGDPSQQANTLAGYHGLYLMFVLDESGGIPQSVMGAAEGALSTEHSKFLKIIQGGNPTHLDGPLYNACNRDRHLWYVITITGDPDDPNRCERQSKKWAQEQIATYGRDNPWVMVNVLGQFPPASVNALLGPDEVEAAMCRAAKEDQFAWSQKRLGIDVARFGDDRTIIFPRQGIMAFKPVTMRNATSDQIAARVAQAKNKWDSDLELIDDTGGYGSGVIDCLRTTGYTPHGVHFSGAPRDSRYKNLRAEMWFKMADWIKSGGCLPKIPEMVAELTTPTYTFDASGKFVLEAKDQIKQRLGRSPDLADALAITFSFPEQSSDRGLPHWFQERKNSQYQTDWDPFLKSK